jgi:hypothetical protein
MPLPVSKQELIQDLRSVGERLGKAPSVQEYNEYGAYGDSVVYKHFGGMVEARSAAGFEDGDLRSKTRGTSRENLIEAIHSLRRELDRVPTRQEMRNLGRYSEEPYRRVFGTWGDAVIEAGYSPYRPSSTNADKKIYNCDYCGLGREELVSQNNNQQNWFCSKTCKNEWQATNVVGKQHHQYKRVSSECSWCSEPMKVIPSVYNDRSDIFCDTDCAGKWYSENRVGVRAPGYDGGQRQVTCQECGDMYKVKKARIAETRFCSLDCLGATRMIEMRGENNPNYNPERLDETGPNWLEQRRKRIQKDEGQCVACGITMKQHKQENGMELDVHHIFPRYMFKETSGLDYEAANELSNLRTMCRSCHKRWEGIQLAPMNN